jgi:hypothetical protein
MAQGSGFTGGTKTRLAFTKTISGILERVRSPDSRRINLKKFIFIACLFSLVLIGLRISNRAPILPEPAPLEEPVRTAPATTTESGAETSLPWPARSSGPEPMTSALIELPEDPDELRQWVRQNPEEALAWLRHADAGKARDTVVEIVCARLAESNPAEAVSLAERYPGGCTNLLENLVHQWADQNEPAARAYAINKPPGEERDRLLGRVAFTRSKENPADAARLVVEWISPGEVQDEAAISVLHQWAVRDPNAALAWARLFPDGGLRDRALTEVGNISSLPNE